MVKLICKEGKILGKEIDSKTANYLIDTVGNNLQMIFNELFKIAIYVGEKPYIELQDIDELTGNIRIDRIFELIDAVCERNPDKALSSLNKMFDTDEHPLKILTLIIRQFRLIWSVKVMRKRDMSRQEITNKLHLHPFILGKLFDQSNNFSVEKIKDNFKKLQITDLKLKSSRTSKKILLEKLVIDLCM